MSIEKFTTHSMLAVLAFTVIVALGCGSTDVESSGRGNQAEGTPTIIVLATPVMVATVPPTSPVEDSGPIGLPAIPVSLPVEPGAPAFSEQSAADYVLANLLLAPDPDFPPPSILRVEFLPIADVEVRIDHPIAVVPRDALLCLVTVRGVFIPDLPPGVRATGTPDPNAVLYQIYDAQTGNYIAHATGIESD